MKPADVLILKEIQEVNRRIFAMHVEMTERFDQVNIQLEAILDEVEQSPVENRYISPELEQAIKKAAWSAASIDQKVSDL